MSLYFLRHGQSEANVKRVFAGQKENSPLTELGKQQAEVAANDLKNAGITKIVSSNLIRAKQTAEIVASELGVSNITIDSRIAEYDMGVLTGTPNQTITSLELVSAKDAEDPTAFKSRVLEALRQYSKDEGIVLLVSHAGVGRMIEALRTDIEPADFYDIAPYPNAQAVKLDLDWLEKYTQPLE
jgi:broad specificity phosphatase PhoE